MKLAIFGASGQGREVADIAYEIGYNEIVFLASDDKEECKFSNKVYIDNKSTIEQLQQQGFDFAIGIGSSRIREKIYNNYPLLNFPNIIHPSVTFGHMQKEKVSFCKGNIICAGVRFTNCIHIGNFGIYNLNATISHDTIIEDFVSIMSAVNVSGNVHIKEGAYVGVNAAILHGQNDQKLEIGANSIIGAGAVVTKNIPDNVTAVGVPARILSK